MEKGIQVRQSFVVKLPRDEAFAFWRRFRDFPRFMKHVVSVEELDEKRSRWVVRGPAGRNVTWDAEIVEEEPGRTLAWRTIGDSEIRHGGRVEFSEATGGRGTVVSIHMSYESPVGKIGPLLAKLLGEEPETQIRGDLRRFKQLAETGEIPTTEGQPTGERGEEPKAEEETPRERKRARPRADRGEVTP